MGGKLPFIREVLKRYIIGAESINLQLKRNNGDKPSGPLEFYN